MSLRKVVISRDTVVAYYESCYCSCPPTEPSWWEIAWGSGRSESLHRHATTQPYDPRRLRASWLDVKRRHAAFVAAKYARNGEMEGYVVEGERIYSCSWLTSVARVSLMQGG